MRYGLRRVLWIVPTLVPISVLAFWLVSRATEQNAGLDSSVETANRKLPRFFNSDPVDLRKLASDAIQRIALDAPDASKARVTLVRLGGAALPFILPELDALPPRGRARVALALAPIARRMGVGAPEELDDPEAALLFWHRFWQDRAIDFRPAVVKRLVGRVARHSSEFRRDDIVQLDTYALAELLRALPIPGTKQDVAAAARVTELLARVTGLPWKVQASESPIAARVVVVKWRDWWLINRADYTSLDGPGRVMAMVTETRYGKWAAEAVRHRFGRTVLGESVLDVFAARLPITLLLLAVALVGGYFGGALLGLALSRSRRSVDVVSSVIAVVLVAVPTATIADWLAPGATVARALLAAVCMACIGAALLSRHQRAQALQQTAENSTLWRDVRRSSTALVSLLGVDLPALLTSAVIFEYAFKLNGLGSATVHAVQVGDVTWLMAMALIGSVTLALLQIASDLMLQRLAPPHQAAIAGVRTQ